MLRPARLPLSRYPLFHATSPDETVDIYSRFVPLRLHGVSSGGQFSWRTNYLALGPLGLVATHNAAQVRAECEGAADAYLLSIALEASAESSVGASVAPVVRGRSGSLTSPWQDVQVVSQAGFEGLQLSMPRAAVLEAIATLTGAEPRAFAPPLRFELDTPNAAPLLRLLAQVLEQAERPTPLAAADGVAELLLFRFLLSQPRAQAALFSQPVQDVEPRHVRHAAEYLDHHFERHVTMAELTRVVGVSARSLQLGFRRFRGCSPLSFLRARRLERARVLLLTSDDTESVTAAAHAAGIEHLGRFSVRYRARFGESPVRTLARRRRAAH